MAVSLTLTPLSNAIIAAVSGLDTSKKELQLFWFLDGKPFATEKVEPSDDAHSFTLAPVYFASTHTVGVTIYDAEEPIESLVAQTNTLYADIPTWRWVESNGQATMSQTLAAYEAATTKGLVADYSHLVWDDFVRLVKHALDEVGLPWLTTYGSYDQTLVKETYGALTAKRFNAVVQNIRYPYWTWESLPGSYGYLGRQAVRSGDTVYGQYMIELAKYLNVMLWIYNGNANTSETSAFMSAALAHDAVALSRHSAPIRHTSNLGGVGENANLVRLNRTLFGASGRSSINHVAALMAIAWKQFSASSRMALSENAGACVNRSHIISVSEASKLIHSAKAWYSPSTAMLGVADMHTDGVGILTRLNGTGIFGSAYNEQLAVATLHAIQQIKVDAINRVNTDVAGSLVRSKSANAAGASSAAVSTVGSANAVRPVITGGSSDVGVAIDGALDNSRPKYTQSRVGVIVDGSGGIEQKPTKQMQGNALHVIDFASAVKLLKTVRMSGSAGIGINGVGKVEFSDVESKWLYPERNGDEITVYQTNFVLANRDKLQIDWVRYVEMFAAETSGVVEQANPFLSNGWMYSYQRNALLNVYQSVGVTQTNDEIEVE